MLYCFYWKSRWELNPSHFKWKHCNVQHRKFIWWRSSPMKLWQSKFKKTKLYPLLIVGNPLESCQMSIAWQCHMWMGELIDFPAQDTSVWYINYHWLPPYIYMISKHFQPNSSLFFYTHIVWFLLGSNYITFPVSIIITHPQVERWVKWYQCVQLPSFNSVSTSTQNSRFKNMF